MNKKTNYIVIFSLLMCLTIGTVFTDYARQLGALLADANVQSHPLSEIEGSENLATKTYVNDALSGISGSNWTVSGSNIYRSSGNVGIGTTSPSATLHVNGNIIANNPNDSNHVATKDYVDNLPGLTWPDGGQPGDTLIMGITGPFWDSPLTWDSNPANRKTAFDCDQIGGTVFDAGGGKTICRYPGSTVPTGWIQADNWQRYSVAEWGGDYCGRYKSFGPVSFSNVASGGTSHGSTITGICQGATVMCTHIWRFLKKYENIITYVYTNTKESPRRAFALGYSNN